MTIWANSTYSASEARGKAWASGARPQTTLTLQETRGAGGLGVHLIARGLGERPSLESLIHLEHGNNDTLHIRRRHSRQAYLICSLSSHTRAAYGTCLHANASEVRLPGTPGHTLRKIASSWKQGGVEYFYAYVTVLNKEVWIVKKPYLFAPFVTHFH